MMIFDSIEHFVSISNQFAKSKGQSRFPFAKKGEDRFYDFENYDFSIEKFMKAFKKKRAISIG